MPQLYYAELFDREIQFKDPFEIAYKKFVEQRDQIIFSTLEEKFGITKNSESFKNRVSTQIDRDSKMIAVLVDGKTVFMVDDQPKVKQGSNKKYLEVIITQDYKILNKEEFSAFL